MTADLPLFGRRVLVTRPARQARGLCDAFRAAGATVIAVPGFRLAAVDSPLLERIRSSGVVDADTVIFTSPSAVDFFVAGAGVEALDRCEVAAVGPATARALGGHGVTVAVTADPHTAEGVVAAIRAAHATEGLAGRRILYPKAADARDVIAMELGRDGARVDAVTIYGAASEHLDDPDAAGDALADPPDVVTFASPTAAIHLEATLTPPVYARVGDGLKTGSMTACIGPVTAEAVARLGYRVGVVARTHTADGLVEAVIEYYQKEQ